MAAFMLPSCISSQPRLIDCSKKKNNKPYKSYKYKPMKLRDPLGQRSGIIGIW